MTLLCHLNKKKPVDLLLVELFCLQAKEPSHAPYRSFLIYIRFIICSRFVYLRFLIMIRRQIEISSKDLFGYPLGC